MRRKRRKKRLLSVILAGIMVAALLAGIPADEVKAGSTETNVVKTAATLQNPQRDENGVVTYDCVYFGSYPQSDRTGKTKDPIKWRVLSVNGNDAFLLADVNLDARPYNEKEDEKLTWETSTIREWLNNEFLNRAFTKEEQEAIKTTVVVNGDNPLTGTDGGNDTEDKVFLLSYDEVMNPDYGFDVNDSSHGKARLRRNTNYSYVGGTQDNGRHIKGNTDEWWLRSPGTEPGKAIYVYNSGLVGLGGTAFGEQYYTLFSVCPALHLDLSKMKIWSSAGTVRSDEITVEGENPSYDEEGQDVTLRNPKRAENGAVTWDCVYFGNYPQSDATGNTKDPIKWRVLSADGDNVFLVADKNLDVRQYDETYDIQTVTWETSTIRSWLNKDFIGDAFTEEEQMAINTTPVVNEDNLKNGIDGGNDTEDKVFLLSYDEVTNPVYGFSDDYSVSDSARWRRNTAYVEAGGTFEPSKPHMEQVGDIDGWWLRSPGMFSKYAMDMDSIGSVSRDGSDVYWTYHTICPALYLNLSKASNLWSYAGTVSTDGDAQKGDAECFHGNTEMKNKKEAACESEGYTGDTYCKSCGEKIKEGKSIPAKGHQWDNGTVTKAATATEDGIKTFTCTVCKKIKTEVLKASGGNEPAVGSVITDTASKAAYQVIAAGNNSSTVEYMKPAQTAAATVSVPASVTINGTTYQVTSIAPKAFKNNKKLKKVVVGGNIRTIGAEAFSSCNKLTNVTIGKNVTVIGDKAFNNCKKLTKITIPAKVNKIGKNAFYGCKNLKSITVKTTRLTNKNVGKKAFKGIYAKATIKVPKKKLKDYKKLLKAKGMGKKVKIRM